METNESQICQASILTQTADYVLALKKEKEALARENAELKGALEVGGGGVPVPVPVSATAPHAILAPPKKRRRFEQPPPSNTDSSSDEGSAAPDPASPKVEPGSGPGPGLLCTAVSVSAVPAPTAAGTGTITTSALTKDDQVELRAALERESAARKILEDQLRTMELTRLQSLRSLQPALLDYTSLLASPYALGLLPSVPTSLPKPDLPPPTATSIAHPSPIKPTLLLGGTSALSPAAVSSFYSSMLASAGANTNPAISAPTPLSIPTVPAVVPAPAASAPGPYHSHPTPTSKQSLEVRFLFYLLVQGD